MNQCYRSNFDQLLDSGLYDELVRANLLLPHDEAPTEWSFDSQAYKVLRPAQLAFVSYPYEWSFSQLRDAALATLEIERRALGKGMTLKDASAYNIQLHEARPKLIDTLSFERYEEGRTWIAYRQFCQHFLAPLALMSRVDVRLHQLFRFTLTAFRSIWPAGCCRGAVVSICRWDCTFMPTPAVNKNMRRRQPAPKSSAI